MRSLSLCAGLLSLLVLSSTPAAADEPDGKTASAAVKATGPSQPTYLVSGQVIIDQCDESQGWFDPNKEYGPGQSRAMAIGRPGAAEKPKPSFKILVRAGRVNAGAAPIAEIKTKPGGAFSLQLGAGDYCAVLDDKRDPPPSGNPDPGADLKCLRKRHRTCDAILKVAGPKSGVQIVRKNLCSWQDMCFPNRRHNPPAMD